MIDTNNLNLTKREADNYVIFPEFNCKCKKFQRQSLTEDQFKCLILIPKLQSLYIVDILTGKLPKLGQYYIEIYHNRVSMFTQSEMAQQAVKSPIT